jgi:uncharacterized protein (TIGR03118 family)
MIMRSNINREQTTAAAPTAPRSTLVLMAALVTFACVSSPARDGHGGANNGTDDYVQTNLVSDQPGVAMLQDTNLVNAWGMSFSSSSPFWISDNGSGLSTLYAVTNDSSGMAHVVRQGLQVTIPGNGTPTGQAFNSTREFHTNLFLFVSEDGTISGWRGSLGTAAEVLVPGSDTNVYKGMTLVSNGPALVLLAANFRQGTIDEYDGNLNLLGSFKDPKAPAGYAPFNVANLDGMVFVAFAKQDPDKHDDVAGPGNGLVDVFDVQTHVFHRLVTGKNAGGKLKEINSPWGLAIAPSTFGRHGGQLLVGNFGSGTIMAFEPDGDFDGLLEDANSHEKPLVIDGLWGLAFGNGGRAGVPTTLYFTAGPGGESHGLFGQINTAPEEVRHGNGQGEDHK